jgi:hypothetical protein
VNRRHVDHPEEIDSASFFPDDTEQRYRERWQEEVLDAIHANDWKAKKKEHVEDFSEHVNALVQIENDAQFYSELFSKLHFPEQHDRIQSINAPHINSFAWIFDSETEHDDSFPNWLADNSGKNLFWITGWFSLCFFVLVNLT